MSRAALWRQEGNVKERERRAEEIYQTAVDEGKERSARSKSILPLWGPDSSFHWNPLLLKNTIYSSYFQKCCQNLADWSAVIDEIYYEVKHLQPFSTSADRTPSTAFCLLLRLLTMRMTDHQMDLTLKHPDSPYIRAIGFLYLRYAGPPEQIIGWIQPYLYDDEEFVVESSLQSPTTTIGQFVRDLFRSRDFHGTPLPRFPLEVERLVQVLLLQAEKVAERAEKHINNPSIMDYFKILGNEIMALYGDEENPVTWYKAVVDRVIIRDETTGVLLRYPQFVVTFPEYGNTETVRLGEIDIVEGDWKEEDPGSKSFREDVTSSEKHGNVRSDDNRRRPGCNDRRPGGGDRRFRDKKSHRGETTDLYDEVRRRERETATAGKGGWARRPPTTKNALSTQSQRGRYSLQDDPQFPVARWNNGQHPLDATRQQSGANSRDPAVSTRRGNDDSGSVPNRKRTAEEMAAIQAKKQNLMAKYG